MCRVHANACAAIDAKNWTSLTCARNCCECACLRVCLAHVYAAPLPPRPRGNRKRTPSQAALAATASGAAGVGTGLVAVSGIDQFTPLGKSQLRDKSGLGLGSATTASASPSSVTKFKAAEGEDIAFGGGRGGGGGGRVCACVCVCVGGEAATHAKCCNIAWGVQNSTHEAVLLVWVKIAWRESAWVGRTLAGQFRVVVGANGGQLCRNLFPAYF